MASSQPLIDSADYARMAARDGEHVCTPLSCPAGRYYVTAVDGPNWWPMAGPYATHAEALANVDRALEIANKHDGRAWFMSWGTARMPDNYAKPGRLNTLGLLPVEVSNA